MHYSLHTSATFKMTNTILQSLIKVLQYTGMWFSPKNYLKFPYLINRCFQILLQYTFLLFSLVYIAIVWGDLNEVSEASYLIFTQATLCIKQMTFLINHTKLRRMMQFMSNEVFAVETAVHEKIVSVQFKKLCKLYTFCMICGIGNCTEWILIPLLQKDGPRQFPFTMTWMPVDISNSSCYVLGYLYQILAVYLGTTIFFTMDFMIIFMIMYAGTQLEISAEKIQKIQNVAPSNDLNQDDRTDIMKKNNKLLNESVVRHQAVLRFVKLVENVFNVNIFFQLSGTVVIVCTIGLRITAEPPNSFYFYSSLGYLVPILIQLYLFCWSGNELTERSQMLRNALYKCPWYEQDARFKRTLWIAMEFMKKPLIFRAGYYIPLSHVTFVSILRCSYSYFAVLNQARN